jgi:hypothetical protein
LFSLGFPTLLVVATFSTIVPARYDPARRGENTSFPFETCEIILISVNRRNESPAEKMAGLSTEIKAPSVAAAADKDVTAVAT